MAKRKQYDWEAIEREYRAGALSIREIARQYGVSHVYVIRKAKENGWERDLSQRVKRAVTNKLVTSDVTTPHVSEDEIVETAALRGVEVVRSHQRLIGDTINLADRLIEQAKAEDLDPKNHSTLFRTIAQGLAKVIPLERQAHNLNDTVSVVTMDDIVNKVHGTA